MKSNDTMNMTEGSPYRLMIQFAIPILLSQLFQQLYNSVDSLIVGNFLGKEALAAVSSSGNLIFFLSSFFIGNLVNNIPMSIIYSEILNININYLNNIIYIFINNKIFISKFHLKFFQI